MAVVVQCFHCNTILELDEGFRGGVCRCSTCGSLLQVPKATTASSPKARPAAPGAQPTQTNRPPAPAGGGDTGLSRGQFETAGGSGGSGKRPAIPDFGGSSSGLRGAARPAAPTATVQSPRPIEKLEPLSGPTRQTTHLKELKKNNALLIISLGMLGLVALVAMGVALWLVMRPDDKPTVPTTSSGSGTTMVDRRPPSPSPATPTPPRPTPRDPSVVSPTPAAPVFTKEGFLGIPLVGRKIIVSVDGASSMTDNFDYVRHGVYQAMQRLSSGQQIQVAVWRDDKVMLLPKKGFIDKGERETLEQEFGSISVRGSSEAGPCMSATMALGCDQVIFVTAKPGLDMSIVEEVIAAKKGPVRIDGVKLDAEDSPSPLEELAKKTGGMYRLISGTKLQDLVQ